MTPLRPRKVAPGWVRRWTCQAVTLIAERGSSFAVLALAITGLTAVESRLPPLLNADVMAMVLLYFYLCKVFCVLAVARAADCGAATLSTLRASWHDALRYITVMAVACAVLVCVITGLLAVSHALEHVATPSAADGAHLSLSPVQTVFVCEWEQVPWSLPWMPGVYVAARYGVPERGLSVVARLAREGVALNGRIVLGSMLALLLVAYGMGALVATRWPGLCWLAVAPLQIAVGVYVYLFCREVFDGRDAHRVVRCAAVIAAARGAA